MNAAVQDDDSLNAIAAALADVTRRSILRLVRDREVSAGELASHFPQMSRPAVSQHVRVLHDAGLVTVRTDGSRRLYRAHAAGLASLSQYLDEFWSDRLSRLKAVAERAEWPQRQRAALARRTSSTPHTGPTEEEHDR